MSDSTVFGDSDNSDEGRVNFSKDDHRDHRPMPVPEVDLTDNRSITNPVPLGMVRVVIGGSSWDFDFKAGEDVAYYTAEAGSTVGGVFKTILNGRTASIDGMQVKGSFKVRDQGIIITVARKPRNG